MRESNALLDQRIKRPSHDVGIAQGSDRVEALLIGTVPKNVRAAIHSHQFSESASGMLGMPTDDADQRDQQFQAIRRSQGVLLNTAAGFDHFVKLFTSPTFSVRQSTSEA